jgi:hypothetical protein
VFFPDALVVLMRGRDIEKEGDQSVKLDSVVAAF